MDTVRRRYFRTILQFDTHYTLAYAVRRDYELLLSFNTAVLPFWSDTISMHSTGNLYEMNVFRKLFFLK